VGGHIPGEATDHTAGGRLRIDSRALFFLFLAKFRSLLPIFFELVSPVVSLYELLYASTKAE
jgi:hypothetical protein